MVSLSKRKLESYRRAEVIAQASRQLIAAGPNPAQELWDVWSGAVMDWMIVTGKVKYAKPKRRGRQP